jgi:RNA polymerase sigma-70 factor (ECF subfamily)
VNRIEGKRFETTRWSMIIRAGDEGESSKTRQDALEQICRTYWFPVYSYVRRRGYHREDAQDLTQEFFVHLVEKEFLDVADKERGRFRSFLLASLRHFLADEWDKTQAKKRGGGILHESLNIETAETLIAEATQRPLTPDQVFDLHWAKTTLANAFQRVETMHKEAGKERYFNALRPFLVGPTSGSGYTEAANELGLSEGAVKVAVHRLRSKLRDALELEISETLTDDADLRDELKYLIGRLSL